MSKASSGAPPALSIYKRLFSYVLEYRGRFAGAVIGMVAYAATDGGFAMLTGRIVDQGFIEKDPSEIFYIPLVLLALAFLRGISGFFSGYQMQWVGRAAITKIRSQVFQQLLHIPTAYFDKSSPGRLLAKLTFDIEQIGESATRAVTVVLRDSLTILVLLGVMIWVSPKLAIFVFFVGVIIGGLLTYASKLFRRYSARIQNSMGEVSHVAEEVIGGHKVVKVFSGSEFEKQQFESVNQSNFHQFLKVIFVNEASHGLIQFVAALGLAAIVYFATTGQSGLQLSAGDFMMFVTAMLLIMSPLKRLSNVNSTIQRGIAAAQSAFTLLDIEHEKDTGIIDLKRIDGGVEFRNVSFSYASGNVPALENVSLKVTAGQTVALVGRSGSGKSTFVNLIPRFYDVTSGMILIDGCDSREVTLNSLRSHISLVSQEVSLFNETIRNNIAYGSLRDVSSKAIMEAAHSAHVTEFADRMEKGIDTMVGDRGVLLSGGQRQRIAIARALLKNSPILVLDEATSALDSESEKHIQKALEALMKNRTTFIVAHRLSTIEDADLVVVLDHGKIVEQGTHAELLARNGAYQQLHQTQFSGH